MDKPDDLSASGHGLMEYIKVVRYREAYLTGSATAEEVEGVE